MLVFFLTDVDITVPVMTSTGLMQPSTSPRSVDATLMSSSSLMRVPTIEVGINVPVMTSSSLMNPAYPKPNPALRITNNKNYIFDDLELQWVYGGLGDITILTIHNNSSENANFVFTMEASATPLGTATDTYEACWLSNDGGTTYTHLTTTKSVAANTTGHIYIKYRPPSDAQVGSKQWRLSVDVGFLNYPTDWTGNTACTDDMVFDEFEGDLIDSSLWTTSTPVGSVTIGSGICNLYIGSGIGGDWWSIPEYAPIAYTPILDGSWAAIAELDTYTANDDTHTGIMLYKDRNNAYLWGRVRDDSLSLNRLNLDKIVADTGTRSVANAATTTTPVLLGIRKLGTTYYFSYSVDDGANWTDSYNTSSLGFTPTHIGLFGKNWGVNNVVDADYTKILLYPLRMDHEVTTEVMFQSQYLPEFDIEQRGVLRVDGVLYE